MLLTRHVLGVHTTGEWCSAVVVQVIVEIAISSAEALLFQEEWIVEEGEGVEDVEFGLRYLLERCNYCKNSAALIPGLTFLAKINASFISWFNLTFKAFLSLSQAVSVA